MGEATAAVPWALVRLSDVTVPWTGPGQVEVRVGLETGERRWSPTFKVRVAAVSEAGELRLVEPALVASRDPGARLRLYARPSTPDVSTASQFLGELAIPSPSKTEPSPRMIPLAPSPAMPWELPASIRGAVVLENAEAVAGRTRAQHEEDASQPVPLVRLARKLARTLHDTSSREESAEPSTALPPTPPSKKFSRPSTRVSRGEESPSSLHLSLNSRTAEAPSKEVESPPESASQSQPSSSRTQRAGIRAQLAHRSLPRVHKSGVAPPLASLRADSAPSYWFDDLFGGSKTGDLLRLVVCGSEEGLKLRVVGLEVRSEALGAWARRRRHAEESTTWQLRVWQTQPEVGVVLALCATGTPQVHDIFDLPLSEEPLPLVAVLSAVRSDHDEPKPVAYAVFSRETHPLTRWPVEHVVPLAPVATALDVRDQLPPALRQWLIPDEHASSSTASAAASDGPAGSAPAGSSPPVQLRGGALWRSRSGLGSSGTVDAELASTSAAAPEKPSSAPPKRGRQASSDSFLSPPPSSSYSHCVSAGFFMALILLWICLLIVLFRPRRFFQN